MSEWNKDESLGANVDRLKTAGVTWRAIAGLATENGHEIPWPDGGKLARARKQHTGGTEGSAPSKVARKKPALRRGEGEGLEEYSVAAERRLKAALEDRSVPWDSESTEEEMLELLYGKTIVYVSSVTGNETQARIPRKQDTGHKHTNMGYGKNGPYVSFASVDGPFHSISLSRIVRVS